MPGIMLSLGGFQFSITTAAHQKLQRSDEYRWANMARLTVDPNQQWIGPGNATVDLDGIIYGDHVLAGSAPGTFQIERMRQEALQGTPLPLVDGRGVFYGLWCVLEVNETATDFVDHGGPRKQAFGVKMIRFGENPGSGAGGGGGAVAFSGVP